MTKPEVKVVCNNGTMFKIVWDKVNKYTLYYKNKTIPLLTVTGGKTKNKWLYLESQPMYSDVLAYMFEEIRSIDAHMGEE